MLPSPDFPNSRFSSPEGQRLFSPVTLPIFLSQQLPEAAETENLSHFTCFFLLRVKKSLV